MLVLRSVLQATKFSFLSRVNSRQNGVISQKFLKISLRCLSGHTNSTTCLHTRSKICLQPPNSFGNDFSNHRHLHQDDPATRTTKFASQYKADKIDKDYELIYSNGISRYYQACQFFLYPVSFIGVIGSANLVWKHFSDFFQAGVDMGDHPFLAGCAFFVASSAMMGVFVNVCQRALLRIYINPQTGDYVAVRFPWNFLKGQIAFTKSEVKEWGGGGILPFNRSNIKINGRPFLIVPHDFITAHQYNTFIGNHETWDEKEDE